MPKFSLDPSRLAGRPEKPSGDGSFPPAQREGGSCDLYAPGHQMHYRHQGAAVRSPARAVGNAILDGTRLTLVLDGEQELRWRHHDPERLGRVLDLVPTRCVAYPAFHALRVGPYWFNCAAEDDTWQDCRFGGPSRRA
jgi:hypothetical protein